MNKPLDRTKPVQTRDGRKVTIYTWDAYGERPIHGAIECHSHPVSWRADGKMYADHYCNDLINVPEKRVAWVNCYKNGESTVWPNRECADRIASKERAACIRIEWTDGEGLEGK